MPSPTRQGVVCPGDVDFIGNAITSLKRDKSMQISSSFALTEINITRHEAHDETCVIQYKNATGSKGNVSCFQVNVNSTGIAYVGGQKLLFHASGSYTPSNTMSCDNSALTLSVCQICLHNRHSAEGRFQTHTRLKCNVGYHLGEHAPA